MSRATRTFTARPFRNVLVVMLAVISTYAQQSARSGTLTGFVTDPSGASVVGVQKPLRESAN